MPKSTAETRLGNNNYLKSVRCNLTPYTFYVIIKYMIKSFKHKGLEKFFMKSDASGVNPEHIKRIRSILQIIHSAEIIQDMQFIGSNLHELKGDRKGIYSVTVRANWRITFEFINGDAYILNYEDYH